MASLVEPLGALQQELPDPIERVVLAAPVAEGLVLDPTAHLVDAAVGHPHHVEGIGHPDGVVEVGSTCRPGSSRPGRWPRPGRPTARPGPGRHTIGAGQTAAFPSTMSMILRRSQVHHPRGVDGGALPVGREERGLVDPQGRDLSDPLRVVDQRGAVAGPPRP